MDRSDFIKAAEKYAAKQAAEDEEKIIETFFEKSEQSSSLEVSEEERKEVGLRIQNKIHKRIKKQAFGFFSLQNPLFRYAAALLLPGFIASLVWISYSRGYWAEQVVVSTTRGEQKEIVLPDGTKVVLNNESSISYKEKFAGGRNVQLTGEAFFDVVKNPAKPFTVQSEDILTTVLGTSFNVKNYEYESSYVTVLTGKVNVASIEQPEEAIDLKPNEQARFDAVTGKLFRKTVDADNYAVWRNKVIRFDSAPLSEVTQVLARWYGVDIKFANEALASCTISGKYKEDTLLNVLEGIKFIIDIDYKFVSKQEVVIEGKGCKK